jgi:hypothetical protein
MMENTRLTALLDLNMTDVPETDQKENTIKDNIPDMKDPTKMKCPTQSMDGAEVQEINSMGPLEIMMREKEKDSTMNMKKVKVIVVNALEKS